MSREDLRQWHRLFGIALTDLFINSPWRVELEKELALQSQLLDVVIIERMVANTRVADLVALNLPDGLEGLRTHNLLTYKSQHEALNAWAVEELIGHYVNYRKLAGMGRPLSGLEAEKAARPARSRKKMLLPEKDFQLYAVATHYPHQLARSVDLEKTGCDGVFDLHWGTRTVRLIVLGQIAQNPRNAPWELFSTRMDRIRHGVEHYHAHSPEAAELLYDLYLRYDLELPNMAYTLSDYARDSRRRILNHIINTAELRTALLEQLPPEVLEERLRGLPPEERLRGLPLEERLRGLPLEERLRGLSPEDIQKLKDILSKLN